MNTRNFLWGRRRRHRAALVRVAVSKLLFQYSIPLLKAKMSSFYDYELE